VQDRRVEVRGRRRREVEMARSGLLCQNDEKGGGGGGITKQRIKALSRKQQN
jgi:hypothetical protein